MPNKVVVFDVDETLGYFTQFGIFWDCLQQYIKEYNITIKNDSIQDQFNECLQLFPEFIRPNIIPILSYLKHKIQNKKCKSVMIYTNNQGPNEWLTFIINFFEKKIHFSLFTHIIKAFKKKGQIIEFCRTSRKKNFGDFIRCSKISKDTQICFIDNTYYPDMNNDNIYYIKVSPYIYKIPFDEMIQRFIHANRYMILDHSLFHQYMSECIHQYSFTDTEIDTEIDTDVDTEIDKEMINTNPNSKSPKDKYEIEKIISKQLMIHIQHFFTQKNPDCCGKTQKNR